LDGFIAGPSGESDWIIMDTAIDFEGFFKEFDTAVMGRRTFESPKRAQVRLIRACKRWSVPELSEQLIIPM
jgi:dihydrofolate reductase